MARLPIPGNDAEQWGNILNEFLRVAHGDDGRLKDTPLNVRSFGARGDGTADDTDAIHSALAAAGWQESVYFPVGTYLVRSGLDITARRIVGEPPRFGGEVGGAIIKVIDTVTPFSGGVLYAGYPPSTGNPCPKPAAPPVNLRHVQIDANFKADYGLYLYGNDGGEVWQVQVQGARLDGFFLDGCGLANFAELISLQAGRHGIHLRDCNGSRLRRFASTLSGSPVGGGSSNPNGYGLFIEAECHSAGVFAEQGDIELGYGPAIYVRGVRAVTTIEQVWVENGQPPIVPPDAAPYQVVPSDLIVLDDCRNVTLQKCHLVGGVSPGVLADPRATIVGGLDRLNSLRAIRLKNGSMNNIIRDNGIVMGGPNAGDGMSVADRIEIEAGCAHNHILSNLFMRNLSIGVPVSYVERTHLLGQQQVICYASAAPTAGFWEMGDMVFNQNPVLSGNIGWVCLTRGTPGRWATFGAISSQIS
jgi:hypothetical protein